MSRLNIGSVSSGTMRPEDLIPAFLDELASQRPLAKADRRTAAGIRRASRKKGYYESYAASEDVNELMDILNEYAPPYFYFGAHPGDGADYGWWLPDGWDEGFDGIKVGDLSEVSADYAGEVICINDHGNVTLYNRGRNHRLYEVWAIV